MSLSIRVTRAVAGDPGANPSGREPKAQQKALAFVVDRIVGRCHRERALHLLGRERHARRHSRVVRARRAAQVLLCQENRHRRRRCRAQFTNTVAAAPSEAV